MKIPFTCSKAYKRPSYSGAIIKFKEILVFLSKMHSKHLCSLCVLLIGLKQPSHKPFWLHPPVIPNLLLFLPKMK